jgi:hypothetical protein
MKSPAEAGLIHWEVLGCKRFSGRYTATPWRNPASLPVDLYWGMGSSSLKAAVKALERLQGARSELLVLRIEIQVVNRPGQVPGNLQFPFDERPVDEELGGGVGELGAAPELHSFPHGFEFPLHVLHA